MIDAFLAQHALLAAVAGALMVAVLPGFLAWLGTGLPFGWMAWPAVLALSLVANFQVTFYLTLGGINRVESQAVLAALLLACCAALLTSRRRGAEYGAAAASAAAPLRRGATAPFLVAALAFLAGISAAALLQRLALGHTGVFEAWDAVVSWNRWAADWRRGISPRNTYGYPQLVPAAWATTYLWLGTDRIEFVAKGLMALFPLAVAALYVDLYLRTRWPAALAALAAWPVLLLRVFPEIVDSGYVDVPVAFFILLCVHLLFLARSGLAGRGRAWLLAAACAAGAVLSKQAGWLAFAVLLASLAAAYRPGDSSWRRDAARALAAFALLAGPALAHQYLGMWRGADPGNFTYVTSTIYGGETLLGRIGRALLVDTPRALEALLPAPAGVALLLALLLAALRLPAGRRCWLGLVLPYYLLWAMFFSYDLRNFMPAVPLLCLGLGLGVQSLAQALGLYREAGTSAPEKPAGRRAPALALAAMSAVLALSLLPQSTREDLLRRSEAERLRSGDAEMNAALLEHARRAGFAGRIFTTHAPLARIPGLQEHFFFLPDRPSLSSELVMAMKQNRPICHIIGLVPRGGEIRYLVLHAGVLPGVIEQGLAEGTLVLLHASPQLRFMALQCKDARGEHERRS
ncbi:MAG: hypothetical protein IT563_01170 [Alphaproteobacteria bacterium]|nr:hypothetical protein [Alphaproteobacteria bacterium]